MSQLNIILFIVIESVLLLTISRGSTLITNLSSIQTRLVGYIFLRWIPIQNAHLVVTLSFLVYCLGLSKKSIVEKNLSNRGLPVISIDKKKSKQKAQEKEDDEEEEEDDDDDDDDDDQTQSNENQSLLKNQKGSRLVQVKIQKSSKLDPLKALLGFITNSKLLNSLNFSINLIISLLCLDATFRTLIFYGQEDLSFSRIGAVGESWAKIHVRIPQNTPNSLSHNLNHHLSNQQVEGSHPVGPAGARVIFRPLQPIGNWITGPELVTSNSTDWNTVAKLENLWPGTTYEYRLTKLNSTNVHHPLFPTVGHFKTAPDSSLTSLDQTDRGSFSFAYTSCVKPGFPYNPFKDPLHNEGAEELTELSIEKKLDFVLFLGDFIYSDSPFYPGNSIKHYHRKYRQSFSGRGWRKLIQSTRLLHIYDDHEILNDWAGQGDDENKIFKSANQAYRNYLGDSNYDGPPGKKENYYWFRYGDSAFFVLDCRRYRSKNDAKDDEMKTMLGENQKRIFLDWLEAVNSTVTFKFVVSSTPFMTLWSGLDGAIDTWSGFLTERNELLDVMQHVPNLIILSGDRHEFAAASIRETIIEFSTSPLNQFWLPIETLSQDNGLGSVEGEDKLIKYIPRGNRKFSTLKVDSSETGRPKIKFEVYVDGKLNWNLTYLAKQVEPKPKESLGNLIDLNWESLLKLLKPIKWFSGV
ncbi:PhoD-like phosphatase-domain-containing protein [Phakopsora pachyrhizi]|uniref:PhoD-like phosphatase-domain-containing protein n=1 Tax=Phakopsora pachyrhizi TaxID=170000 RepID=A0AAV0B7N6_PHAPC|nr:PhoD-like phosphatase-domain-containing protein [Phakopsora pachyrhizi]CAH7682443.1 PhoD-like phosphatase-domain-containing protein [Phakopsora pachyrhizi]